MSDILIHSKLHKKDHVTLRHRVVLRNLSQSNKLGTHHYTKFVTHKQYFRGTIPETDFFIEGNYFDRLLPAVVDYLHRATKFERTYRRYLENDNNNNS